MYDYLLGGSHNFAVDRVAVDKIKLAMPTLPAILRANRSFLRRAVRYFIDEGVNQFLDLGSGVPTVGNVHEVAQAVDPGARIVYVDIDPVAVAHSEAILAGNDRATVIHADLRRPEQVFDNPAIGLLDLDRPVAILALAVVHFLTDDDQPGAVLARYRDRVVPGSFLAISHASLEGDAAESAAGRDEFNRQQQGNAQLLTRSPAEITAFFDGYELVEPGLVYLAQWRPEPGSGQPGSDEPLVSHLAEVGRKL
jgi:O-methyltransferase involved in polyketide biosynthesis